MVFMPARHILDNKDRLECNWGQRPRLSGQDRGGLRAQPDHRGEADRGGGRDRSPSLLAVIWCQVRRRSLLQQKQRRRRPPRHPRRNKLAASLVPKKPASRGLFYESAPQSGPHRDGRRSRTSAFCHAAKKEWQPREASGKHRGRKQEEPCRRRSSRRRKKTEKWVTESLIHRQIMGDGARLIVSACPLD